MPFIVRWLGKVKAGTDCDQVLRGMRATFSVNGLEKDQRLGVVYSVAPFPRKADEILNCVRRKTKSTTKLAGDWQSFIEYRIQMENSRMYGQAA